MDTQRLFDAIPAEAADVLRSALPGLADAMIAAIAVEVPAYARAMEGNFGRNVRLGVEVALGRFIDLIEEPARVGEQQRETYVNLGRGELHAGRSMDALLSAYRIGARVAWRRFVDAGVAGDLPPDTIYRLGEAIFAYIDGLSAESAEGYAQEQMAEAGERHRRRRRLVRLLAQHPPAGDELLQNAAAAADWPQPATLAALVVAPDDPDPELVEAMAERLGRRVGQGAMAAALEGVACAIVPDPDAPGTRRRLDLAVDGAPAALGPTVPFAEASRSVRRAVATLRLVVAEPERARAGIALARDRLGALLLAADPELAAELAAERLAPLETLAPGPRRRMAATLRAWLDRPGQVQAVADALGVHPQTVRYRLRQLRDLFGERLEDPDGRFELALALRAAN